jgi:ribonuclease PH
VPVKHFVAAISVGVYRGTPVMTEAGNFVEVQGTAEGEAFDRATMNRLLDLGQLGISELIALQKKTLGITG